MLFGQGASFMGLAAIGNNRMVSAGARGVGKIVVGSGVDDFFIEFLQCDKSFIK